MSNPFADLLKPTLPSRFSVSFIGSTTECMQRAVWNRDLPFGGPLATIGRAAHEVFATCEFRAQMAGLSQISVEEAVEIAYRVLGNPEEHAPMTHGMFETVIKMTERWAQMVVFPTDADEWVIEHPFRLPLIDWERNVTYIISGRMDEYAIWNKDRHYRNRDWKTGPGLPTKAQVEEEHTQLPIYAWAAHQKHPWLETFECEEFYSRRGVPRVVNLTAGDMPGLEAWLIDQCRGIVEAYAAGQFDAVPGDRWCNLCPMPDRCPYPESVRKSSIVNTEQDAIDQIKLSIVLSAQAQQAKGAYRGYLEGSGTDALLVEGRWYGFVPKKQKKLDEVKLAGILEAAGVSKDDLYVEEESQEFGSKRR